MASLLFPPLHQFCDSSGKPLNGGKVYLYDAGTTDDAAAFTDAALSSAATQPVILDSAGRIANIYVAAGQYYKVVVKTSADATVGTSDNIPPSISYGDSTLPVASGGTGSTTASAARTALAAAAASDVATLQSTVATIDGQITAVGGTLGSMAAEDSVALTNLASGFKRVCVQEHYATSDSEISMSTTIPFDDTIPTVTEGVEVFTTSFTPLYDDSVLEIMVKGCIYGDGGNASAALAIFTSNSTNALAVSPRTLTFGYSDEISAQIEYEPGSTSALTISARVGANSTGHVWLGQYGVANKAIFRILEYKNSPIT